MPRNVHLTTCQNPRSVRPRREPLLTVKQLALTPLRQAESFDESSTYRVRIVVPYGLRDIPQDLLQRGVDDSYSSHGCDHEYDCCGCRVASVSILRPVRRGVFDFILTEGRNY